MKRQEVSPSDLDCYRYPRENAESKNYSEFFFSKFFRVKRT